MSSKKLPFFKWYPADALGDDDWASMNHAERGFFIECLNYGWINDGIPADPAERAKLLKTRQSLADRLWKTVGRKFIPNPEDNRKLICTRQRVERQTAVYLSQVRSESAKARSNCSANAQQSIYISSFASSSLGGVQGGEAELLLFPVPSAADFAREQEAWFVDKFWPLRWRNQSKQAALAAWQKKATSEEKARKICEACVQQKPAYEKRETEMRPHMATWLNQERYLDEVERFEPAKPKGAASATVSRYADIPQHPEYWANFTDGELTDIVAKDKREGAKAAAELEQKRRRAAG